MVIFLLYCSIIYHIFDTLYRSIMKASQPETTTLSSILRRHTITLVIITAVILGSQANPASKSTINTSKILYLKVTYYFCNAFHSSEISLYNVLCNYKPFHNCNYIHMLSMKNATMSFGQIHCHARPFLNELHPFNFVHDTRNKFTFLIYFNLIAYISYNSLL